MVPVDQQASEGGQDEEHHDEVQQRGTAHHHVQTVHGQQRTGQAAQKRRPEQAAAYSAQHEHREGAQSGRHEAPAERVQAEHRLTEGDHPLARRRVRDEGSGVGERDDLRVGEDLRVGDLAVRPGALVAEPQHGPGVLRVIRLVEHDGPRPAEVPEADGSGQHGDEYRPQPLHHLREAVRLPRPDTCELPQARGWLREGRNKTLANPGAGACHVTEPAKTFLPGSGRRCRTGLVEDGETCRVATRHRATLNVVSAGASPVAERRPWSRRCTAVEARASHRIPPVQHVPQRHPGRDAELG